MFLDQQRRVARGVRLVLDDPDLRTIPGDLRRICWKAGYEAEQVQRHLLGDADGLRDRIHPTRQPIPGSVRAASRGIAGRFPQPRIPQQVIPVRMGREACHNGLAGIGQVVREAGQFVTVDAGVDEQHATPALHDDGVALHELAHVGQHTVGDLPQHALASLTSPSA